MFTEADIKQIKERGSVQPVKTASIKPDQYIAYEDKLTQKYRTRVSIKENKRNGKITLYFNGEADLKRILDELE